MVEQKKLPVKLIYHLKQDTPMIHFQYDESGAGIRASELKPKLDQFLAKKYGTELKTEWKIPGTEALNYKVRLFFSGESIVSQTIPSAIEYKKAHIKDSKPSKYKIQGMYFGNMANTAEEIPEKYKESVFYKDGGTLEIICLYAGLRERIDASIDEFFAVTNFGTRQDKGFGGFSIANGRRTLDLLQDHKYCFFYTSYGNGEKDYTTMLNIADAIYSAMKGGKNLKSRKPDPARKQYVKGYIQRAYLDDCGKKTTGSDKAFIKSKTAGFFPKVEGKDDYQAYEFVRAILGLADHIDFRDDRKGTVKIADANSDPDKRVKRYKSPVTIKIVDAYIFFIWNDTFEQIKGKTFTFSGEEKQTVDRDGNSVSNVKPVSKKIKVPDSFDPEKFIKDFIEYYNNSAKISYASFSQPYKNAANITLQDGNPPEQQKGER